METEAGPDLGERLPADQTTDRTDDPGYPRYRGASLEAHEFHMGICASGTDIFSPSFLHDADYAQDRERFQPTISTHDSSVITYDRCYSSLHFR
jgi:hypothetical protein